MSCQEWVNAWSSRLVWIFHICVTPKSECYSFIRVLCLWPTDATFIFKDPVLGKTSQQKHLYFMLYLHLTIIKSSLTRVSYDRRYSSPKSSFLSVLWPSMYNFYILIGFVLIWHIFFLRSEIVVQRLVWLHMLSYRNLTQKNAWLSKAVNWCWQEKIKWWISAVTNDTPIDYGSAVLYSVKLQKNN